MYLISSSTRVASQVLNYTELSSRNVTVITQQNTELHNGPHCKQVGTICCSHDINWFKLHLVGFNVPRTTKNYQLLRNNHSSHITPQYVAISITLHTSELHIAQ